MTKDERIAELELALSEMLAQFWCNYDYDDQDKAVLDFADSVLNK